MNQQNYDLIVDLLLQATKLEKISWEKISSKNGFGTNINNCCVTVSTSYDFTIDETSFSLTLSNTKGEEFANYYSSENSDKNDYAKLRSLYYAVRDVVYRITESENLIISGLKEVIEQSDETKEIPY